MGRDHARIKCYQLLHKKNNWKSVIARLLDTHIDPPSAKNVYFPLGATEFFQTHPNVLEYRPRYNKNIKKVHWAYVDNYVVLHSISFITRLSKEKSVFFTVIADKHPPVFNPRKKMKKWVKLGIGDAWKILIKYYQTNQNYVIY